MSPPQVPKVKLANGQSMPIVGLGTWKSPTGKVCEAVKDALELGYHHIDCAFAYLNEDEVGKALKESFEAGEVKREDVFLTSKVWNTYHMEDRVVECCRKSLAALGVEYLDLYLIHWPFGYKEGDEVFPSDEDGKVLTSDVDYLETWRGMERCLELKLVKSVGLSNFNSQQIQRVLDHCKLARPQVLQVECHPYLTQEPLLDWCRQKNIVLTAYSPLGSPDRPWAKPTDPQLLQDPKIQDIAKKHHKSPAQVLIRFQVQRGIVVIPKSVTRERIRENLNVFDFELDEEDMAAIRSFNRDHRFLGLEWMKDHAHYPFNIPY